MRASLQVASSAVLILWAAFLVEARATQPTASSAERGALVSAQTVAEFSRAVIDHDNADAALSGPARCDVRIVQLTYVSIGVEQEPAVLSAGLYVPEHCNGPFPLVAQAHGTQTNRRRLSTEIEPGNSAVTIFAAQGYLVVVTDYLGLGKSDYPYHPYLHAASEASAIIDAIRAARVAARQLGTPSNEQVMLFGYSQGGHAAMAAQREIELHHRAEINLVAAAPMAGPYYLSQTFLSSWFGRTAGEENTLAPELLSYTIVNYNHIYKNIYHDPHEVFAAPYADLELRLFPNTQGLSQLRRQNLLPSAQHLNELRNPAFTAAFMLDEQQPFREDLRKNDLLDWTPTTPMLLCGSRRDGIVDFNNAYAAQAFFKSRGVDVPVIDVADDIPATATGTEHHNDYGVPLCFAAARSRLFDPIKLRSDAASAANR